MVEVNFANWNQRLVFFAIQMIVVINSKSLYFHLFQFFVPTCDGKSFIYVTLNEAYIKYHHRTSNVNLQLSQLLSLFVVHSSSFTISHSIFTSNWLSMIYCFAVSKRCCFYNFTFVAVGGGKLISIIDKTSPIPSNGKRGNTTTVNNVHYWNNTLFI